MKNYQPDYYNNFKCIADKCSITCCQEWKIAVDDATNRKWKKLSADKVSGKSDNLSSYTCHKDGSLVIKLDEKHRCPFLSKDKLCHLVMKCFQRHVHCFPEKSTGFQHMRNEHSCRAVRQLSTCGAKNLSHFL